MANFLSSNIHQTAMIVIDFKEQIEQEPFARTLHNLIENHINLSEFYKRYNNGEGGIIHKTPI